MEKFTKYFSKHYIVSYLAYIPQFGEVISGIITFFITWSNELLDHIPQNWLKICTAICFASFVGWTVYFIKKFFCNLPILEVLYDNGRFNTPSKLGLINYTVAIRNNSKESVSCVSVTAALTIFGEKYQEPIKKYDFNIINPQEELPLIVTWYHPYDQRTPQERSLKGELIIKVSGQNVPLIEKKMIFDGGNPSLLSDKK